MDIPKKLITKKIHMHFHMGHNYTFKQIEEELQNQLDIHDLKLEDVKDKIILKTSDINGDPPYFEYIHTCTFENKNYEKQLKR